jgi:hypothetical protein
VRFLPVVPFGLRAAQPSLGSGELHTLRGARADQRAPHGSFRGLPPVGVLGPQAGVLAMIFWFAKPLVATLIVGIATAAWAARAASPSGRVLLPSGTLSRCRLLGTRTRRHAGSARLVGLAGRDGVAKVRERDTNHVNRLDAGTGLRLQIPVEGWHLS